MSYDFDSEIWQEKRLESILLSDLTPTAKVQKIVALGMNEEEAEEVVRRYQIGEKMPVYYEQLEFVDDLDLE